MTEIEEEKYLHILRYLPEHLDWMGKMLSAGRRVLLIGSSLERLLLPPTANPESSDLIYLWLIAVPAIGSRIQPTSTAFQYPPCKKEDLGGGWFASTLPNDYNIRVVFYMGQTGLHASISSSDGGSESPVPALAEDTVTYYDASTLKFEESFLAQSGNLPYYFLGRCWLPITLAITSENSARTFIIPAIPIPEL
jgi:hypothetical protein